MTNPTAGWWVYKNGKYSQCSAWPRWYLGFSNGKAGLGIVREQWGWRIMLGPWDFCKTTKDA